MGIGLGVPGPVDAVLAAAQMALEQPHTPHTRGPRGRTMVRIVVEENRILIAGQSEAATVKAVCRFLEELGCRYFMDGPLGEVFPRSPDLAVKPLSITEKPGLLYRNPKGPSWNAAGNWTSDLKSTSEQFFMAAADSLSWWLP